MNKRGLNDPGKLLIHAGLSASHNIGDIRYLHVIVSKSRRVVAPASFSKSC
jgi:hypothetical protein